MNDANNMTSAEAFIGAAREFEKQEQWQEAAVKYQLAIELSPDCAQSHFQLGNTWSKLKRGGIALSCYQQAFELNSGSYLYCIAFAEALKQQGKPLEALATYKRATQLDPTNPAAYQQVGDIHLMKACFHDAVSAYQKAIDLGATNDWVFCNLGRAYIGLQQFADAIPCIRHAINSRPNFGIFHFTLGEALVGENQMQEALDAFSKATQLEPENFKYCCDLGELYTKCCRYAEAIPCFVEVIKIHPQHQAAYKPLGLALYKEGQITSDELRRFDDCVIPDRIIESLFDIRLVEQVGFDSDEFQYIATEAGESIVLTPRSITATLNAANGKCREQYLENAQASQVDLLEIKNGRAYWDGANPVVMTATGKIIRPVSNRNSQLVAGTSQNHEVKHIEGVAVFISQRFAAGLNYFHWFFQDIVRLHLLEVAGIKFGDVDKFVFVQTGKDFQQETLEILGIPASKVIQSINEPHISADRLLVPSQTHVIGTGKWACKFLRDRFVGSQPEMSDEHRCSGKIYITRNSASIRRVVNEDELIPLLKACDFEIVKMEELSIREKVTLLSQAKVVITAHGAALTNLVFCNPGTRVVEIFPSCAIDSMDRFGSYSVLAHQSMLEHHYFFADNAADQESVPELVKDLSVDVDQFEKMLELIL